MAANFLIIGDEGRLRDGLRTVLRSFIDVNDVFVAADLAAARDLIVVNSPSLVIIDGSGAIDDKCTVLKQLHTDHERITCIVIANTLEQKIQALKEGADAVLMQGFSTKTLCETLVRLSILPDTGEDQEEQIVYIPGLYQLRPSR
jgi:DNA-binding NarL/FixJ family response regulator